LHFIPLAHLFSASLSLLAYSPLAFGHLTGKYLPGGSNDGRATQLKGDTD
jgi:aryl-alcohol dehydrogenase-like predicted oxidoreductase